ncbi:MAG: FMN-binding negative transcriptional regulator [Pseudomonadota bacterium]
MYVPKSFRETDTSSLLELIQQAPLGILVLQTDEGLEANHIPFVYRESTKEPANDTGLLCAHLPRANPLCSPAHSGRPCLVIFSGPSGYISPSWYASKKDHGKVVPTWNYTVVHVHGHVRLIDDETWLMRQIEELTERHEATRAEPWSVSDAPAGYTQALLKSLLGMEVRIDRLEGKTKASQNQPGRNQMSVLQALREEQPDTELSEFMHSVLEKP